MAQQTYMAKMYKVQRTLVDTYAIQADSEEHARAQAEELAKVQGIKDNDIELSNISFQASAGAAEPQDQPKTEETTDGGQQNNEQ